MNIEDLGDLKHIVREAQIKLLKDSQYLGGVVDMIEEIIDRKKIKIDVHKHDDGTWP